MGSGVAHDLVSPAYLGSSGSASETFPTSKSHWSWGKLLGVSRWKRDGKKKNWGKKHHSWSAFQSFQAYQLSMNLIKKPYWLIIHFAIFCPTLGFRPQRCNRNSSPVRATKRLGAPGTSCSNPQRSRCQRGWPRKHCPLRWTHQLQPVVSTVSSDGSGKNGKLKEVTWSWSNRNCFNGSIHLAETFFG